MKALLISMIASASVLYAQSPTTPSATPHGLHGSALDQPASGGSNEVINGIQVLKATWGIPGQPPQQIGSKVRRFIRESNASSSNKVSIIVSEDFAQIKTQTDATYRGNYVTNGNAIWGTTTKDAKPMLTIVYRVDGVQKMTSVPLGGRLVFP
jgi:hypothetical protein